MDNDLTPCYYFIWSSLAGQLFRQKALWDKCFNKMEMSRVGDRLLAKQTPKEKGNAFKETWLGAAVISFRPMRHEVSCFSVSKLSKIKRKKL